MPQLLEERPTFAAEDSRDDWFRGYARTFNELSPNRHKFLVLVYCARHNDLVDKNETNHLNPYATTNRMKKASRPYSCEKALDTSKRRGLSRSAAPAKRVMKAIVKGKKRESGGSAKGMKAVRGAIGKGKK